MADLDDVRKMTWIDRSLGLTEADQEELLRERAAESGAREPFARDGDSRDGRRGSARLVLIAHELRQPLGRAEHGADEAVVPSFHHLETEALPPSSFYTT